MSNETITCRLCEGKAVYLFSKKLLQKYEVAFFRCHQCKSLQTEAPYWLDEAYAGLRSIPDIAAVERVQKLQLIVYFVAKIFGLSPNDKILDWGGGDGLLVRMLRDLGLDAYLLDKYITNRYAVGFEDRLSQHYKMITCFETWEHFSNPKIEIEKQFQRQPEIIFLSTSIYKSQGINWNYLTPLSGRHVFFYSKTAMEWIAHQFGYEFLNYNNFSIFYKSHLTPKPQWFLKIVLSGRRPLLLRILLRLIPRKSLIGNDRKLANERIEAGDAGKINWP
ncbi:MAG: methyltransferase domain-containing protein [Xenococcaceae cyanobacterium MO_188.B32]|nr:methyltransferase domain-containing protein [Xenococcaceae cyanobacterium MO_188.B32]